MAGEAGEASCSAAVRAEATASLRDSVRMKRESWYFWARAWPDSPRRIILEIFGACKMS